MSLLSPSSPEERPFGVAVVAALCWAVSALALLFAALVFAGYVPLSQGAFLIGGGAEQMGPVVFLLYAALNGALGYALWMGKRWSRRLAIFVAAAGIAVAVPAISSAFADERAWAMAREGLQIVVRVVIVYYLSQEPVKDWFAK